MLAAAYLLIVKPLLDFYSQKAEILVERQELVRRLAVAAEQLPDLRAQLVELKSTANARKITIDGASDAIASANLQSRIGELAASTGVTIGSTEAGEADFMGNGAENRELDAVRIPELPASGSLDEIEPAPNRCAAARYQQFATAWRSACKWRAVNSA